MKMFYFEQGYGQTFTIMAHSVSEAKQAIVNKMIELVKKGHEDQEELDDIHEWLEEAKVREFLPGQVLTGEEA